MRRVTFIITAIILIISSCKKEKNFSGDSSLRLAFSSDTVTFDTVFTAIGSATKKLMVYNRNGDDLKIGSIRLKNGSSSMFSINVDGHAGHSFNDVEILNDDSLYIFVKTTIDPNDGNNPFLVEDELIFNTNGNEQKVLLTAYGQNAIYIVADQTVGSFPKFKIVADSLQETHWTAEKPYVIYGYALIDSYGTLVIEPGTRIYIHNGGGIWAYSEGQLIIDGTLENPVTIQGDRLEHSYDDEAGQWDRIWLMEARQNCGHSINNAIIKNGFIGIQAERFVKNNYEFLNITNTVIDNMSGMGIYTNLYSAYIGNVSIRHCGQYAMALTGGGSYVVGHSTIANNWAGTIRNTPSLYFDNLYYNAEDGNYYPIDFDFTMNNSIVYGNLADEFKTDFYKEAATDTSYKFNNCIIRTKRKSQEEIFSECLFNKDPMFTDYNLGDLHPDSLSPAIGFGNPSFSIGDLQFDLEGTSRSTRADAGCLQSKF